MGRLADLHPILSFALTQNPKVKIGKVFAADDQKQDPSNEQKIHLGCKANRLSQPKAVAVLGAILLEVLQLCRPAVIGWLDVPPDSSVCGLFKCLQF